MACAELLEEVKGLNKSDMDISKRNRLMGYAKALLGI